MPDTLTNLETPGDLAGRFRALERSGHLALPPPGGGATAERHAALLEFGRADLSLARLVEAHTDALAILTEAGREEAAARGLLYGVWAADGPGSRLDMSARQPRGTVVLNGVKRYCSGAGIVDAALITAHEAGNVFLLNVSFDRPGVSISRTEWASPAFAGTRTTSVVFDNVQLDEKEIVGPPNWYLTRPGFWHGALGPAACWAGGAVGLVDAARALNRQDPHSQAQVGGLEAAEWGLRALLVQAAGEIDADPRDTANQCKRRSLSARHLIERLCTDVMDRFGRATGPQLLAFDADVARRYVELTLYIRQSHAERDLAAIPAARGTSI